MSSQEGPASITGDVALDLALHRYLNSDAYKAYDAVRTPTARELLEQSDAHKAYRRVVDSYLFKRGGLPEDSAASDDRG
jgi:hypothetical protein